MGGDAWTWGAVLAGKLSPAFTGLQAMMDRLVRIAARLEMSTTAILAGQIARGVLDNCLLNLIKSACWEWSLPMTALLLDHIP
jgi:hypothetical protein